MKRLLLPLLLISGTAHAAPFTYAPETCDFQITFPEKPFIEQKCVKDTCHDVVTYTSTNASSALNYRLTCIADEKADIDAITEDQMKETLNSLAKEANVTSLGDDNATLDNGTRTAVVVGGGKRGEQEVVYTGQLWLGQKSVLTLEAEMTGPADEKIEKQYVEILKSLNPKESSSQKTSAKSAD